MDRLIYTAFSGLSSSMVRQRVVAANMANAQTVGYRADTVSFTPMTLKGDSLEVRAMNETEVYGANMAAGSLVRTGKPLDIALDGRAMLTVQATDGKEAYTRRGDLSVDPTGLLVNGDGVPVMGQGGPITVPPNREVVIAPDGQVMLGDPGAPDTPPVALDRLKLVNPAGTRVEKGLDGLFRVYGGGVLPTDEQAKVVVGNLEQSNVNASDVLVQMIAAQRLFDIRTKLVATAKEIDEGGSQLMKLA